MTSTALGTNSTTTPSAPYALLPPAADVIESFQGAAGYHRGDHLICQWASQTMTLHRQAVITPDRLPAITVRRAELVRAIDDWTELHVLDGPLAAAGLRSPGESIDALAAAYLRAEHLSLPADHRIAPATPATDAEKRSAWAEVDAAAVSWAELVRTVNGR
ncbi:hypothetical protein [Nocardia salmonicida]|uniref:hypothetical protein n=1 Tax=Nocardia salmonicida TaxID=53431 RepID=UPI0007A4B9AF|nr:hypothetical protein [Nocardia salmonicida]MBC7299544.1 hypothetical protein [Nocardia sp.]